MKKALVYISCLLISSCSNSPTDSKDDIQPHKWQYTKEVGTYIASTGDTLRCFEPINFDEFINHSRGLYYTYRKELKLPEHWTDSRYCDCNYFHTRMQLQDKDHLQFKEALPSPCLSELLRVMRIKTIHEMREYEEEIILYIQATDLAHMSGGSETSYVDSIALQKLIQKYSASAEECLNYHWATEKDLKYVEMCNFMVTGGILNNVREKWSDPGFMYFCRDVQDLDTTIKACHPSDLLIEYQFIEQGGNLTVERRFLNPCVEIDTPVF